MQQIKYILLISSINLALVNISLQLPLKEFLTLNHGEKQKLDMFKAQVKSKVPHEYMTKDVFLIRWLRDVNFDVPSAEKKLMANIKWRRENRIDTILQEDWAEYDNQFRVFIEGCDLDGKPIVSVLVGEWDIRREVIAGNEMKMRRYFDKLLEESTQLVRRMMEGGQNVTQAIMIFDMEKFNLIQQGCPRCIPIYLHILLTVEQNYPGFAHRIIAVNMPQIAIPLWNTFRSIISPQSNEFLRIYGKDKKEWKRILLKEIDKNQLTKQFGGTIDEPVDYVLLRNSDKEYTCDTIQSANIS